MSEDLKFHFKHEPPVYSMSEYFKEHVDIEVNVSYGYLTVELLIDREVVSKDRIELWELENN